MAQVSKNELNAKQWGQVWDLWLQTVINSGRKGRPAALFGGLLTQTEKVMLAKRLVACIFIQAGWTPYKVAKQLKLSLSTAYKLQQQVLRDTELSGELQQISPPIPPLKRQHEDSAVLEIIDMVLSGYRDRNRLIYGKVPKYA